MQHYERSEVAKHCLPTDCWVIVRDGVYDVTQYMRQHPGGAQFLLKNAGADASADFAALRHSQRAERILSTLRVGTIQSSASAGQKRHFKKLSCLRLRRSVHSQVSDDTMLIKFKLPQRGPELEEWQQHGLIEDNRLCLPPGWHVRVHCGSLSAPFTPVTLGDGFINLLVKTYPNKGRVARYICDLPRKQTILVSFPVHLRNSVLRYDERMSEFDHVVAVAAGTGIAPIFSVMRHTKKEAKKGARVPSLTALIQQRTSRDMLLRRELTALSAHFQVTHFLSRGTDHDGDQTDYSESDGATDQVINRRIGADDIERALALGEGAKQIIVLLCGPVPGFHDHVRSLLDRVCTVTRSNTDPRSGIDGDSERRVERTYGRARLVLHEYK